MIKETESHTFLGTIDGQPFWIATKGPMHFAWTTTLDGTHLVTPFVTSDQWNQEKAIAALQQQLLP